MRPLLLWIAIGVPGAAPAAAVEYTPVKGDFQFDELEVECPGGAPACYICINDENTTGDHRLMLALGASHPNLVTTGIAAGVLHPFIERDGVRLDPPLLPCGSFFRSGIRWFDRPFAQNCPDTTKGLIYRIGDMTQVEVTGDGDAFLDIAAVDADGIRFMFSLCSEFVHWGAGCGISGSSQYGWRLHTPAVPSAAEVAPGDAAFVDLPGAQAAFDFSSGPGGIVSVARVNADPPGAPAIAHLNGYWDVHSDMPGGSFSAEIAFDVVPASLPGGIDVSGLVVARYDPATDTWEAFTTTVDVDALSATILTDRVGKFVLLESAPVPVDRATWGGLKAMWR